MEEVNSLILSDLHLGSPFCRNELIVDVLEKYSPKILILNGDVFHLDDKTYVLDPEVIEKFIGLYNRVEKVIWTIGNHDDAMINFIGRTFDKIEFYEEYIYKALNNRKYLIYHGHAFHYANKKYKPRIKFWIGSKLYKIYLRYSSLTWITDRFINRPISYAKFCRKLARSKQCDGIICGHNHRPILDFTHKEDYINSGDWLENFSYVIEKLDGTFELISGIKND